MASLDLSAITYSSDRNLKAVYKAQVKTYYSAPKTTVTYKPAYTTTSYYKKTTYYKPVTYSSYYYSGYKPVTYRTYIPLVYYPVNYWNVYTNRLPWGAQCNSDMQCRSGCCSSTAITIQGYKDTYNFVTGSIGSIPSGVFTCENYSVACGYGVAGGSGGIVGAIVGLIFLCAFCALIGFFMNRGKNVEGGTSLN